MRNSKIHVIIKLLTIIFISLSFVLLFLNIDDVFNVKRCYYNSIVRENFKTSYWNFNGIDVDDDGNIYIGKNDGIIIVDSNGKVIGCFTLDRASEFYSFKVENNIIKIASNISLLIGENTKTNYTYEAFFDNTILDSLDTVCNDKENTVCYKQNFWKFKKENDYNKKYKVEKNNLKYEYDIFGRIRIIDKTKEKIIYLDTSIFPLPIRFALIPALFFLCLLFVSKFIIKHKISKTTEKLN